MSTNLVKIEVLLAFKSHGLDCHPEEVRKFSPELAKYFVDNGWAKYPGGVAPPVDTTDKTLEVQDGQHTSGSTEPV